MPNEVVTSYNSGSTLYFVVMDENAMLWNNGWEAVGPDWSLYANPMTETGVSGVYYGDFPASIGEGLYYIFAYNQATASPLDSDEKVRAGAIEWDGTGETVGGGCNEQEFQITVLTADTGNITTGVDTVSTGISIVTGEGQSVPEIEVQTGVTGDSLPKITVGVVLEDDGIEITTGID